MLDVTRYDLSDAIDQLEQRKAELSDESARLDPSTNQAAQLDSLGSSLDTQISGLQTHLSGNGDVWQATAIEIGTLSAGERQRAYHIINDEGAPEHAHVNYMVAMATADAPYLDHDPDVIAEPSFDRSALLSTVRRLAGESHPGFVDWAEVRVNESFRDGVELGNRYSSLVRSKRIQHRLTKRPGSDTS